MMIIDVRGWPLRDNVYSSGDSANLVCMNAQLSGCG